MNSANLRKQLNQRKAILEIAAVFSNSRLDEDQQSAGACNVLKRYCRNVTLRQEETILDTAVEVSEMLKRALGGKRGRVPNNSNVQETYGVRHAATVSNAAIETTPARAISSHQAAVNSLLELSVAPSPDALLAVPFEDVPALFRAAIEEAGTRPEETDLIEHALMLIDRNGGDANIRTPGQEQFYADLVFRFEDEQWRVGYAPSNVTVH
jgi:hypothetical protein